MRKRLASENEAVAMGHQRGLGFEPRDRVTVLGEGDEVFVVLACKPGVCALRKLSGAPQGWESWAKIKKVGGRRPS